MHWENRFELTEKPAFKREDFAFQIWSLKTHKDWMKLKTRRCSIYDWKKKNPLIDSNF